jgi:hypothetical protein
LTRRRFSILGLMSWLAGCDGTIDRLHPVSDYFDGTHFMNHDTQRRWTMFALGGLAVIMTGMVTTGTWAQDTRRISIRMGDQTVTATLNDGVAARDLFAMLPVTLRMDDHLRREKTGVLPRGLSKEASGSPRYELADLGYWPPRGTFVIFYRQDGLSIPSPGIVLLGKVNAGVEIFDHPGSVEVTVERLD